MSGITKANPRWNDQHTLYRAYDRNQDLLYIGITHDIDKRMRWYDSSPRWKAHVVLVTFELHPNRGAAHMAETHAIVTEHPAWNVHTR